MVLDYATHYLKAVLLWKATSPNIAKQLVLLFIWVGIPKDILTDQSIHSYLISQDLCQLLQVCHLYTLVYHPQTNGLVEHFNQTLKHVTLSAHQGGPQLGPAPPHMPFVVCEAPQVPMNLMPFELLFGQQP